MRITLYQPDIPQNTGTILRLCACLGVDSHIIEPAGFDMSERAFRRAGMDYLDHLTLHRHRSFEHFLTDRPKGRLLLATTKGTTRFTDFTYRPDDILLLGRESSGVPEKVHDLCDERLYIPMHEDMRSLNIAMAAAMIIGEMLRQTNGYR